MTLPLLELNNITKHYPVKRGIVLQKEIGQLRAVDGVSFQLMPGETLALVGESGCGKSTTARLAMRLISPTSGTISYDGRDITHATQQEMRALRREIQIIFQDPYASLNPRMTVEEILIEPMEVHGVGDPTSRKKRVRELLGLVELASYHAQRYPHEFSGGQRQRIGIARALALSPKLIVCDEPVSALDVSIQAQIVNLLKDLQGEFGLAYLFISHGLAVVRHVSDRVAVMYLGQIVEITGKRELYANPRHPYTQALLAAAPEPDPNLRSARQALSGDVPSPMHPPSGCRFHPRCPHAQDRCKTEVPVLRDYAENHAVACHFAELLAPMPVPDTDRTMSATLKTRLALYARERDIRTNALST